MNLMLHKATPTPIETGAGVAGSVGTSDLPPASSKSKDDNMTVKTIKWCKADFTIQNPNSAPFIITVSGRNRWTLEALMRAGEQGCTPITRPAPRWSGYVFDLRELGVDIITITEPHKGHFPGSHARYVLRSIVTPLLALGEAV